MLLKLARGKKIFLFLQTVRCHLTVMPLDYKLSRSSSRKDGVGGEGNTRKIMEANRNTLDNSSLALP